MVRTYKPKVKKAYSKEDLEAAVNAVKYDGMRVLVAAKKFNVPRSTISDHVKDAHLKVGAGHPTVFSIAEEKELVAILQVLQEIGFGLTKELVSVVISDYLHDQPFRFNPFNDNSPGKDWWRLFMNRWQSELSLRKPQHLSTHRASCSTPQVFDEWFNKVEKLLEVSGLKDLSDEELKQRMWNCDESGFCTSTTSKKILSKRGDRYVHETVGGSGREFITLLGAGCADGTRLPPYVLYKGKNLWSRWMQGGPAGCMYSVSDSGWMESANFFQWFQKMFLPAIRHLTATAPVVLFFDGHHSHLSIRLIELARSNNVHLVCFPPHSTHLIQPLDVGVFGPMKSSWRTILKWHQIETCATIVTKHEFPSLISRLWDKSFRPDHLINGFNKTGVCPLSRKAITSDQLVKSLPFSDSSGSPSSIDLSSSDCSSASDLEQSSCTRKHRIRSSGSGTASSVTVNLVGTCTVDSSVTPVRLELKGYFSRLLQKNQGKQAPCNDTRAQKVKPQFYGEAVTLDEIYQRLRDEEEAKKKQLEEAQRKREEANERKREAKEKKMKEKKEKEELRKKKVLEAKKKKDESELRKKEVLEAKQRKKEESELRKEKAKKKKEVIVKKCGSGGKVARRKSGAGTVKSKRSDPRIDSDCCQECNKVYENDDQYWMGCDLCARWYHHYCVGFSSIPDGTWLCPHCT